MAARSEYFRSYHLLVLSAEQNDNQSEEINVIDKSQTENRPVPVQAQRLLLARTNFDLFLRD